MLDLSKVTNPTFENVNTSNCKKPFENAIGLNSTFCWIIKKNVEIFKYIFMALSRCLVNIPDDFEPKYLVPVIYHELIHGCG